MAQWINEETGHEAKVWRSDRAFPYGFVDEDTVAIRWGCTVTLPVRLKVVNEASGIHTVNNKARLSLDLHHDVPDLQPECMYSSGMIGEEPLTAHSKDWVVRPLTHSRGRNLEVVHASRWGGLNLMAQEYPAFTGGWYARRLIDKEAEYRVYVMAGRVVSVAKKTPGNPEDVAWNVAQGGRFDVVRWGDWPLDVCEVAVRAAEYAEIDFCGVDVMVEKGTGTPYFIEANSAPSLPYLSDGSVSYRQKVMAKAFAYQGVDYERLEAQQESGWQGYIHPALYEGVN